MKITVTRREDGDCIVKGGGHVMEIVRLGAGASTRYWVRRIVGKSNYGVATKTKRADAIQAAKDEIARQIDLAKPLAVDGFFSRFD